MGKSAPPPVGEGSTPGPFGSGQMPGKYFWGLFLGEFENSDLFFYQGVGTPDPPWVFSQPDSPLKKKPDVDCRACEAGVGRQRCHDCRLVERLRRHELHWVGVHININKEEAKTERICARKQKSILVFQFFNSANFQKYPIQSNVVLFQRCVERTSRVSNTRKGLLEVRLRFGNASPSPSP